MKSDPAEKKRLLAYFAHRSYTYINILKDCFKARKGGAKFSLNDGASNSEHEIKRIFKLVNKKADCVENLPQDKVDARALEAIERFRREYKVDKSKKIFAVLG